MLDIDSQMSTTSMQATYGCSLLIIASTENCLSCFIFICDYSLWSAFRVPCKSFREPSRRAQQNRSTLKALTYIHTFNIWLICVRKKILYSVCRFFVRLREVKTENRKNKHILFLTLLYIIFFRVSAQYQAAVGSFMISFVF
jgi:hypothetical protein